jgi:hypothetical protein
VGRLLSLGAVEAVKKPGALRFKLNGTGTLPSARGVAPAPKVRKSRCIVDARGIEQAQEAEAQGASEQTAVDKRGGTHSTHDEEGAGEGHGTAGTFPGAGPPAPTMLASPGHGETASPPGRRV